MKTYYRDDNVIVKFSNFQFLLTFHVQYIILFNCFWRVCGGRDSQRQQDSFCKPFHQSQLLCQGDDGQRRPPHRHLRQKKHRCRRRTLLRLQVLSPSLTPSNPSPWSDALSVCSFSGTVQPSSSDSSTSNVIEAGVKSEYFPLLSVTSLHSLTLQCIILCNNYHSC